jgi:hypothetical protein
MAYKFVITEEEKQNILEKYLLSEDSKALLDLISKFSKDTTDTEDVIKEYINDFKKYQKNLPTDKRDINKYSYEELKNLIDGLKSKKDFKNTFDTIFKYYKETTEQIPNLTLTNLIKRFLEIKNYIPQDSRDIFKYNYTQLKTFIDNNYKFFIKNVLLNKFRNSANDDTIKGITDMYLNYVLRLPENEKLVTDMTFDEFERVVSGLESIYNVNKGNKSNEEILNEIPLIYNENNLKIYRPDIKIEAILLNEYYGGNWCVGWPGANNLYYRYRLDQGKTMYYVIDSDKEVSNPNSGLVVLVNDKNQYFLADRNNQPKQNDGSIVRDWSFIVEKNKKLENLKNLFVPIDISGEDLQIYNKYKNITTINNPNILEYFNNNQNDVSIWLDIATPKLTDAQYISLPDVLKKKYIDLGRELSPYMIQNSSQSVITYINSRKLEQIKNARSINQLSSNDIAILSSPVNKQLKEELKSRLVPKESIIGQQLSINLDMSSSSNNQWSKYVNLYGLSDIFDYLPDDLITLKISNTSNAHLSIKFPESFGRLTELTTLYLENVVKSLPNSISNLENLTTIALVNNKELRKLPTEIGQLPMIYAIRVKNCPNLIISDEIKNNIYDEQTNSDGSISYNFIPGI